MRMEAIILNVRKQISYDHSRPILTIREEVPARSLPYDSGVCQKREKIFLEVNGVEIDRMRLDCVSARPAH
jgi:hypothetical protein